MSGSLGVTPTTMRRTNLPRWMSRTLLLGSLVLVNCTSTLKKLDNAWRVVDPVGHHRMHRDKVSPYEHRSGIHLQGEAGRSF